jgi:hypothetical protein
MWWPILIVLLLYGLIIFGIPLIAHREKGSYLERLKATRESEDKFIQDSDYVWRYFSYKGVIAFSYFWIIYSVTYNVGHQEAFKKKEFLVYAGSPEMVVLRIYGDNLICAPFDREKKEVQRSFTVIKIGESPKTMLNLEIIGPLHVKAAATNLR